jgi:acyl carrier protein
MNTVLYYVGIFGALVALLVGASIPLFIRDERKRKRQILLAFAGREPLDKQSFYGRYFQPRGVPADVVLRIRRILETVLDADMSRLRPEDDFTGKLKFFFEHDELSGVYIVDEIEKEFGITISDEEASRMHTISDIVTVTWAKLQQRAA